MKWFEIILLILFLGVAYYDFKDRLIPLVLFILLSLGLIIRIIYSPYYTNSLSDIVINSSVLTSQFLAVASWFGIKKKKLTDLRNSIGAADIWLLILAVFLFKSKEYIWFITLSSFVSILFAIGYKVIKKTETTLIPFAGIASIAIVLWHVLQISNYV